MHQTITSFPLKNHKHFPAKKVIVVDASDPQIPIGYKWDELNYQDVGIALQNPTTSRVTDWYLDAVVGLFGDIEHWIFRPTLTTLDSNPQLAGYVLKVFNT